VTKKSGEIQRKLAVLANELVGDSVTIVDTPITHIKLPEVLIDAVKAKQQMQIQADAKRFELLREKMDAEIKVVKAEAEAKSLKVQAEAVKASPELIKLKMVNVEAIKADKWNGVLPTTIMGSGATTLFKLN